MDEPKIRKVKLDKIIPFRPRHSYPFTKGLIRSVAKVGPKALAILIPCVDKPGFFYCIDKNELVTQAKKAGKREILALVYENLSLLDTLLLRFILNTVRNNFRFAERAERVEEIVKLLPKERGRNVKVADMVGHHPSLISKFLRVKRLPEEITKLNMFHFLSVHDGILLMQIGMWSRKEKRWLNEQEMIDVARRADEHFSAGRFRAMRRLLETVAENVKYLRENMRRYANQSAATPIAITVTATSTGTNEVNANANSQDEHSTNGTTESEEDSDDSVPRTTDPFIDQVSEYARDPARPIANPKKAVMDLLQKAQVHLDHSSRRMAKELLSCSISAFGRYARWYHIYADKNRD